MDSCPPESLSKFSSYAVSCNKILPLRAVSSVGRKTVSHSHCESNFVLHMCVCHKHRPIAYPQKEKINAPFSVLYLVQ
jgi:hypothetical protein